MDKKGIEPLAMKLLAGLILLAAGLGIGITMYRRAGRTIERLAIQISLDPASWTLSKPENENSLAVRVEVRSVLEFHENVTLSLEGKPPGVNVSFTRVSGVPDFYSTLTIRVTKDVTPGTYDLTVKAEGGGAQATSPFRLIII